MAPTQYFSWGSRNTRARHIIKLAIVAVIGLIASMMVIGYYNDYTRLQWRVDSMSTPPPKNPRPPQDPIPEPLLWSNWWTLTTIPKSAHVQGFTLLDNIYLRNGTFYVVTHDRALFPPRENLLSRPVDVESEDEVNTEPTDEQLRFISHDEAFYIFGEVVKRIKGLSVIVYDPPQRLMKHYDSWFGEVILGAWRVYSHLSPEPVMWKEPPKHLPLPRRFILPFMDSNDLAGMHGPLMRLAFPDATIGSTAVFERVMLVNRNISSEHSSISLPLSSWPKFEPTLICVCGWNCILLVWSDSHQRRSTDEYCEACGYQVQGVIETFGQYIDV
ncbi:hypothetical protein B0H11DRAFT_2133920 [Mycena galericulata]|nr:hypothetical protein B0H11DRAFT_2133920 [Mycena galericulata]